MKRMTIPVDVAQQLREAIKASGMNAQQVAKAADVAQAAMYRFMAEGSTKTLNLSTAQAVALAIGYELRLTKLKK